MALPVLDGNQSATTLSSVVTGGEHIVAHSVVSLGTTAIANIASAVSGVNIGGTVTANINGTPSVTIPQLNRVIQSVATDGVADTTLNFVKIGGHQSGSNQTAHIVHVSTGGAMSVDATDSVVSISNFPATQTIAGTVTANVAEPAPGVNTFISESGSFSPAYAVGIGYNTANNTEFLAVNDSGNNFPVAVNNSVTIGSLPAISGTVTANVGSVLGFNEIYLADADNDTRFSSSYPFPIAGTVTVGNAQQLADALIDQTSFYAPLQVSIQGAGADVPVVLPKGALTTRFGSVATANLAFITSAVTNTSRKYLLAQNISAGTVTIGIGFSPTTTQGIQLTAGGGLTFDAFCPTGAVYWLGAVTGAAFTILEG